MKRFFTAALSLAILFSVTTSASGRLTEDELPASETLSMLASYIDGVDGADGISPMVAVGAVILNRCADARFSDSISANGASLGIMPVPTPSDMAFCAARLALSGIDPTSGAVVFFADSEKDAHPDEYVTFSVSGISFAVR